MTDRRKIACGVLFALSAALLVLGVFFDKALADLMFQPDNVPAKIMESVGIFPPFLFVSGMFAVLFYLVKADDKYKALKKCLTAAGVAVSYLIFGFMTTDEVALTILPRILIAVGASVLLTPLTLLLFRKTPRDRLKRLSIFLIFASMVAVISSLISINVIKYFWGRVRYREMIAEGDYLLEGFTPWYHANGFTLHGHHSFPSGHTCSAANLLVLLALPEVFPEAEEKRFTIAFVIGLYIFAMAYSRMVLGAHFLSDVTFGFLIGFVTYLVARYVYFDKTRLVVDAILEVNGAEAEKFSAQSVEPSEVDKFESAEAEQEELGEPISAEKDTASVQEGKNE